MESINSLEEEVYVDHNKKNVFPCSPETMTSESFAHKLPLA